MNLQLGADRIHQLANAKGTSVNKMLVNDLKLSKSVVDNMKKGSEPSADKIEIIAKYLGTSVSYILGKTDDPNPLAEKKDAPATMTEAEAIELAVTKIIGKEPSREKLDKFRELTKVFFNES